MEYRGERPSVFSTGVSAPARGRPAVCSLLRLVARNLLLCWLLGGRRVRTHARTHAHKAVATTPSGCFLITHPSFPLSSSLTSTRVRLFALLVIVFPFLILLLRFFGFPGDENCGEKK